MNFALTVLATTTQNDDLLVIAKELLGSIAVSRFRRIEGQPLEIPQVLDAVILQSNHLRKEQLEVLGSTLER